MVKPLQFVFIIPKKFTSPQLSIEGENGPRSYSQSEPRVISPHIRRGDGLLPPLKLLLLRFKPHLEHNLLPLQIDINHVKGTSKDPEIYQSVILSVNHLPIDFSIGKTVIDIQISGPLKLQDRLNSVRCRAQSPDRNLTKRFIPLKNNFVRAKSLISGVGLKLLRIKRIIPVGRTLAEGDPTVLKIDFEHFDVMLYGSILYPWDDYSFFLVVVQGKAVVEV